MAGYFVTRKKRVVVEVTELVYVPNCTDPGDARKRAMFGEGEPLRGSEKVLMRRGRDRILEAEDAVEA